MIHSKSSKIIIPMVALLGVALLVTTWAKSPSETTVAQQTLRVVNPFTYPTPPGATVAAVFTMLVNDTDKDDRLVAVESSAAREMQMHETVQKDGALSMLHRPEGFEIPAGGTMELKPGGAHLMLMGLKEPLRMDEIIVLKLDFEVAGTMEVKVPVKDMLSAAKACCSGKGG